MVNGETPQKGEKMVKGLSDADAREPEADNAGADKEKEPDTVSAKEADSLRFWVIFTL